MDLNIRKGNSSGVTQMWDQIFDLFGPEYNRFCLAMSRVYAAQPGRTEFDVFKHDKTTVVQIICEMHKKGIVSWVTPAQIMEAWHKVGITFTGLDVSILLQNPQIRQDLPVEDGAEPTDQDFTATKPWETPTKLKSKKHTAAYWKARSAHSECCVKQLQVSPQTVFDILTEDKKPRPKQVAMVGHLMAEAAQPRSNHLIKTKAPTGDIYADSAKWYFETKQVQKDMRDKKIADQKVSRANDIATYQKYVVCTKRKPTEECECGGGGCVLYQYHFCAQCETNKQHPLTASGCSKAACGGKREWPSLKKCKGAGGKVIHEDVGAGGSCRNLCDVICNQIELLT